jgi:hypothetical protein
MASRAQSPVRSIVRPASWPLVLVALAPAAAWADASTILNPGRIPIGDLGALEGGAMIARSNDGSATWYNPAGLVRADRPSISSNASLYELNRITLGSGKDAETASTFNIVPNYLGSVGFIVDEPGRARTAWGFAVTVPTHWKSIAVAEQSVGTPESGLSYSRFSSASEVRTLVPGVAVAHDLGRFVEGLSVGAGLSVLYTTEYQQWTLFERQDEVRLIRQAAFVQDSMALQGQFSLGVGWRAMEGLDLGLSVKLPTLDLYDKTVMDFGHAAYDAPSADAEHGSEKELGYKTKRPTEFGLGVAYSRPRVGVELDAHLRLGVDPYSRYGASLDTDYELYDEGKVTNETYSHVFDRWSDRPVFNLRLGGYVGLTETLKWHFGGFTDRSPMERSIYDDYGGYYQKVDLFGATTGISYSDKSSMLGLGLSYTFSGDMTTESYDLATRENVVEDSRVDIIGFIMSGRHYF